MHTLRDQLALIVLVASLTGCQTGPGRAISPIHFPGGMAIYHSEPPVDAKEIYWIRCTFGAFRFERRPRSELQLFAGSSSRPIPPTGNPLHAQTRDANISFHPICDRHKYKVTAYIYLVRYTVEGKLTYRWFRVIFDKKGYEADPLQIDDERTFWLSNLHGREPLAPDPEK